MASFENTGSLVLPLGHIHSQTLRIRGYSANRTDFCALPIFSIQRPLFMSDKNSSCPRNFPSAADDADRARQSRAHEELLTSASYRLAYDDQDFMLRDEMRPMRLMLELSKPELVMSEHGIDHTVVMFGSSRVCDLERAQAEVAQLECECQLNDVPNPMLDQALKKARTALEYAQRSEEHTSE